MTAQEDFHLNKVRCEIAMQQVLQEWQPKPQTYGMECPKCDSSLIVKNGRIDDVQRYLCNNCQRNFKERSLLVCDCLIPGHHLKCQSCPQFKKFLETVKLKLHSLQRLSIRELQNLRVPS